MSVTPEQALEVVLNAVDFLRLEQNERVEKFEAAAAIVKQALSPRPAAGESEPEKAAIMLEALDGYNATEFLRRLAQSHEGRCIVSTASLEPMLIEIARKTNHLLVLNDGLGFVLGPVPAAQPKAPSPSEPQYCHVCKAELVGVVKQLARAAGYVEQLAPSPTPGEAEERLAVLDAILTYHLVSDYPATLKEAKEHIAAIRAALAARLPLPAEPGKAGA